MCSKSTRKDVKLVLKNLPLPFHKRAKPAARAALAAGAQGKYWEMHDLLFENQSKLDDATFFKHAEKIGLDMAKFKADYNGEKFAKMVDEDMALATKLGVRGTPGFFINGVKLQGAQPLPEFKRIIDEWLKRM